MDLAQMGVGDVRIDLGRVDGGMAEKLLDGANVGAVREQVGGEGVAKRVRRDDARDAGARDVRLQVPLDIAWNDAVQFIRPAIDKQCLLHIISRFQVFAHRILGRKGNENDADLVTLAAHRQFVAREIDVGIKRAELGYAQSRRKQQFKNRAIPQICPRLIRVFFLLKRLARRLHEPL